MVGKESPVEPQNEVNEVDLNSQEPQPPSSIARTRRAPSLQVPGGPERKPSVTKLAKPSVTKLASIEKKETKSSQGLEHNGDSSIKPQPQDLNDSQQQPAPQATPQVELPQQELLLSQQRPSLRVGWSTGSLDVDGRRLLLREFLGYCNQLRYNCGMIINNTNVQFFLIFLIVLNAIMMGVGTFDFVTDNPDVQSAFESVDKSFLIVFTIELVMQFIYHGYRLVLDGWLLFDLIIIVTSWLFSSVQVIRAFRIFRALRLVTRIKIMKNLILALFGVMPRMAAVGLMLFLIFYIFGVMFTQLFKDLYEEGFTEYDYFSRMDATFFTLFQIMTLDNWADIAREVIRVHKWAWLPFTAFVIISGFIVVNLIIAVICEAISALDKDDKDKLYGNFDGEGTDSDASYPELEIRQQLDCLEEQMTELTRIQAKAFHTLQYLTRQVQMQKLKQEVVQKRNSSITVRTKHSAKKLSSTTTTTPST